MTNVLALQNLEAESELNPASLSSLLSTGGCCSNDCGCRDRN